MPVWTTDVLAWRPSSDLPRTWTSPSWASPRTSQGDVLRDDDAEAADVDASLDVRLRRREADIAQVEGQFADSELVGVAEILRAGDDVAAVADAVAEMDVERGRDDRSAHEQKREQRAERDRHALDEASHAPRVLGRERRPRPPSLPCRGG